MPYFNHLAESKYLFWLCGALVFLYPLLALVVDHGGSTIYSLLALLGLGLATFQHRKKPLGRDEKWLFFSVVIFVAAAVVSVLLGDNIAHGFGKLRTFAKLLLLIPVYLLLRRITLPQSVYWYGLACGAIISGVVAIYEVILTAHSAWNHWGRASGATHPILFGNLSLMMGVMAFAGPGYFRARNKWMIILPIVAILCGLLASFLSGSRGGWLAMPALLVIVFWYVRSYLSRWQMISSVALVIMLPLLVYLLPNSNFAPRIDSTINNLKLYDAQTPIDDSARATSEGTRINNLKLYDAQTPIAQTPIDDSARATSEGTRLEMWQASWTIFKKNPILGVGWGNYQNHAKALLSSGERHRSAVSNHPHNEYFSVLASGGLLGLVALLVLFFIPAKLFFAAMKNQNPALQQLGLSGLLLVVGYMHFALSEAIFERSLPINFYAFYLLATMVLIDQQISNSHRVEKPNEIETFTG